jgi:uncharacterized protein (TIGR02594 family)
MLPAKFAFVAKLLEKAGGKPYQVEEAVKVFGLHELKGADDNVTILGWAKTLGVDDVYKHDSIPWCGLAMGWFMTQAEKGGGFDETFAIPKGYLMLRALEWAKFGEPVVETGAMFGDVLVFHRDGGGHVGLYVGESTTAFFVLGGNEGDAVSIVAIGKDRLSAVRRPPYEELPPNVQKVSLADDGSRSTDEA